MAFDNRSGYNNRNNQGNYGSRPGNLQPREAVKPAAPMPLPKDFVDAAEQVMLELKAEKDADYRKPVITTSKIRNLLSMVMDIYNVEVLRGDQTLLEESAQSLTMARVRMIYEAGREQAVKDFLKKAKLLEYIKDIGSSRPKLIAFTQYMEALVAYHRFYIGGKEG